ncbi:MAG: HAMP domain-containing sensor histidine kinase [Candidatus Aminicenantes bacterium]|nr:HAMP domain-containing sensor histidine kinase [Candidatus Aminicenantes bacterium]
MRLSRHLRLVFVVAVLVPCAVLAVLSVRSLGREEAFLEKRLAQSLDAELTYAVALVRENLGRIEELLSASAPADPGSDPRAAFAAWKKAAPLVGVPFLLDSDFRILWPTRTAYLDAADLSFLNWNREFISDAAAIPFYQNAALLYRDQVTGGGGDQGTAEKLMAANPGEVKGESKKDAAQRAEAPVMMQMKVGAAAPAATAEKDAGDKLAAKSKIEDVRAEQQALSEFEQSDAARKRVYDEAARMGQKAETRNVRPAGGAPAPSPASAAPRTESIYISEPRRFSEITAGREAGLIPRFIEEKLGWLFWKRLPSGRIVGCRLDDGSAKAALLARLPDVYSPARILTFLDENGRPLVTPAGQEGRDWRRPVAAREVSEILPRWEAAAYATDPGALASRARATRYLTILIILAMFVVILSGGTVVLATVRSEMALARQKTTFVTNVSHELKTPLTSIRMFSEMLKDGRQPDPDKQKKYLGLMASETERLTRLINNVLDFSRMEKGRRAYARKRFDLGALVEALVESERTRLEPAGFSVVFHDGAESSVVEADEEAVKQAVLNLLSNAEKYSAGVKSIEVEVGREGGTVCVDVKDRGIGVPPAEREKIFREFYRVDTTLTAPVRGSGLGLTIARRILRDLGGDVSFAAREGGGSVFRISLPEAGRP